MQLLVWSLTTLLYPLGTTRAATLRKLSLTLLQVAGLDVNKARTDDGQTPLYAACSSGYVKAVERLLEVDGLDVNQACTDGSTALHAACEAGHVEVVKRLLQVDGLDVNHACTGINGETPLLRACQMTEYSHVEIVERLLQVDGLDVNQGYTDGGATPLHVACLFCSVEIVERLLQVDGLDVNKARTDNGATPLYVACERGHVQVVERLVQVDALDVNQARTDDGRTPLIVACEKDRVKVVELCVARCVRDAWQPRAMMPVLQAAVEKHALSSFQCVFTMNAEALCASTLLRDKARTWPEPFASMVRQELTWRRQRTLLAISRLLRIGRASSHTSCSCVLR